MGHSIRLRFVGWFHSLFDEGRELIAKHLGKRQIEPEPGAHSGLGTIAAINNRLGKGQVDDAAVYHAALSKQAGHNGTDASFLKDPVYIAYAQRLAASNHNFISHQKSPAGTVFDVSKLNSRNAGVQS